jgi:hypothetical protein
VVCPKVNACLKKQPLFFIFFNKPKWDNFEQCLIHLFAQGLYLENCFLDFFGC